MKKTNFKTQNKMKSSKAKAAIRHAVFRGSRKLIFFNFQVGEALTWYKRHDRMHLVKRECVYSPPNSNNSLILDTFRPDE